MIRLVVDISLSPVWVDVFKKHGWPAVHWSGVGDPRATDRIVMAWARENESQLQQGAIVTVDESRGKVRTLPIGVTQRDSAHFSGN